MLRRFFGTILGLLLAAVLVTVAVTNRKIVTLVLDPFTPANPVVAVDLPFYVYLFAMLIVGALIGGMAMWFSQAEWRRMARQRAQEAAKWKGEADRMLRERDQAGQAAQTKFETRELAVLR